jgi:hypothetical protein
VLAGGALVTPTVGVTPLEAFGDGEGVELQAATTPKARTAPKTTDRTSELS